MTLEKKSPWGLVVVILMLAFILFCGFNQPIPTKETIFTEEIEEVECLYDTISINRATRYNACASQCDSSPFKTADGTQIVPHKVKDGTQRIVALSRELIYDEYRHKHHPRKGHWQGKFKFGDTITIQSKTHPFLNGEWLVADVLNKRYSSTIDFLTAVGATPKLGIGKDIKIIFNTK